MSAFGGKADVRELPSGCLLIAKSGHWAPLPTPPVESGPQRIRPDPSRPEPTSSTGCYADVLYEILSESAKPPFEPAGEILQWAQEALDDALRGWQGKDCGGADGEYEPPIEAKRSMTEAIFEALKQAAKNGVLQEAAKKRFQAGSAMVAAE